MLKQGKIGVFGFCLTKLFIPFRSRSETEESRGTACSVFTECKGMHWTTASLLHPSLCSFPIFLPYSLFCNDQDITQISMQTPSVQDSVSYKNPTKHTGITIF